MLSKYTEKNKFGGYTWQIKIDNLFHIYILGTDNSSFVVEFKEWKWISYKTHFTFVSDKDLKSTIKDVFEKVFDFFQKHNDYLWSQLQKTQKLEIVLKEFEELSDIPTSNEESIDEKPKSDMLSLFNFRPPASIPISLQNEIEIPSSAEMLDKKVSAFLDSGNLDGAINLLEIYVAKNETDLSSLIMLARFKILKKDRNEVRKIIVKIMTLTQSNIGFLSATEIEDIDIVMAEFGKM
jgi:hypothetical protein